MRVLLGSLGFLCLEIVLNCEIKHPGTRLWVAEQITSCTTVFGAGAGERAIAGDARPGIAPFSTTVVLAIFCRFTAQGVTSSSFCHPCPASGFDTCVNADNKGLQRPV